MTPPVQGERHVGVEVSRFLGVDWLTSTNAKVDSPPTDLASIQTDQIIIDSNHTSRLLLETMFYGEVNLRSEYATKIFKLL